MHVAHNSSNTEKPWVATYNHPQRIPLSSWKLENRVDTSPRNPPQALWRPPSKLHLTASSSSRLTLPTPHEVTRRLGGDTLRATKATTFWQTLSPETVDFGLSIKCKDPDRLVLAGTTLNYTKRYLPRFNLVSTRSSRRKEFASIRIRLPAR